MKAIILGREINGVKIVEEIRSGVDENYKPKMPIITSAEIPDEIPSLPGKLGYLGYDEETEQFVIVYENRPLTEQERLNLLEKAMEDLILGGV